VLIFVDCLFNHKVVTPKKIKKITSMLMESKILLFGTNVLRGMGNVIFLIYEIKRFGDYS
jgi:hypothetical protein